LKEQINSLEENIKKKAISLNKLESNIDEKLMKKQEQFNKGIEKMTSMMNDKIKNESDNLDK